MKISRVNLGKVASAEAHGTTLIKKIKRQLRRIADFRFESYTLSQKNINTYPFFHFTGDKATEALMQHISTIQVQ